MQKVKNKLVRRSGWLSPDVKVTTSKTNTEGQRFTTTAAKHNQNSSTRQQDTNAVRTNQETFGTTPDMVQLPSGYWTTRQDSNWLYTDITKIPIILLHKKGGRLIPKYQLGDLIKKAFAYIFNNENSNQPLKSAVDTLAKQPNNTSIENPSDDDIVDNYINYVMWTMENPKGSGYNKSSNLYYPYSDKDLDGKIHHNLGPGLESNNDLAKGLDYSGKTGYTKEFLNARIRPQLINHMRNIRQLMDLLFKGISMPLGDWMVLLDIAHNVRPKGQLKNLPLAWPNLSKALHDRNYDEAYRQAYSGSDRRASMRKLLFGLTTMDGFTLKNI